MGKLLDNFLIDYSAEKNIEKRLDILLEFINYYYDSDFEKVNIVLEKELNYFKKNNYKDGEALVRFMFAYSFFERGDFIRGQEEVKNVMEIFENVKHPEVRAQILNFLAFLHSHQGNFDKAFEYCYAAIKEGEKAVSKRNVYWGPYTLGVFYFDLKDFENAEKCYKEALDGFTKYDNKYGIARSETGLSSVYIQNKKYEEAEKLLQRSLTYYSEIEVTSGQSRSLNDLGVIFKRTGKLEKALDCFQQALKLRKETHHSQGIATSLNEIAEVLMEMKDFKKAEELLFEAKAACEKINNKSKLYRTHFLFSQLYRKTNEPWKALDNYDIYEALKSEVVGETANNKIKELQTRMITEKAEQEKEIERLKNVELKKAYDTIEEKQKEITDSIKYAKRIQYSLLAHKELLDRNIENYFVLFLPKDIVSGDFYWATEKQNDFYLAVCDSTGHGVPGAFMSLLNISFLNEAINEKNILAPNEIFNYVRKRLTDNTEGGKDGMDATLIRFEKNKITYSSANNKPIIISNNNLIELAADKMPVGKGEKQDSFQLHEINATKGDTIYFYTDGYADQFGGEKGEKKLTRKKFKELLLSIQHLSMGEQKQSLEKFIINYRKEVEQIDDILVMGVRV